MSFGDICAQAILECSLKQVAEANKDIDIIAALMILIDWFVDDLPRSDLKEGIERQRGEILDNWQTTGALAAIFAKGGFILKVIACSGDKDGPMDLDMCTQSVQLNIGPSKVCAQVLTKTP